jgi:hypothetical protein
MHVGHDVGTKMQVFRPGLKMISPGRHLWPQDLHNSGRAFDGPVVGDKRRSSPLALARPISSFISKLKKFVRSVVDKAACQHISSRSVKQRFLTLPTGTSRKARASLLKNCQNVTASLSIE